MSLLSLKRKAIRTYLGFVKDFAIATGGIETLHSANVCQTMASVVRQSDTTKQLRTQVRPLPFGSARLTVALRGAKDGQQVEVSPLQWDIKGRAAKRYLCATSSGNECKKLEELMDYAKVMAQSEQTKALVAVELPAGEPDIGEERPEWQGL